MIHSNMLVSLYDVQVVVSGLDHTECVNFGPDGRGYAGGEDGQLVRFSMDGKSEQVATVAGGGIGGFCLDGNGNVYECDYRLPHVYKITADGKVSLHSRGTENRPAVLPNYPVFDSRGNLYYSDSGDFYKPNGRLFVIRPDGRTEHLFGDHLHFPNGLAIDAEEKWLYVIQSAAPNILRFPLRGGNVGEPEVYIALPGTVPDGLAFAESGNLYVSYYVPDLIERITPDRKVQTVVQDFVADKLNRPTNIAFAPGTSKLCFANLGGFTVNAIDVGEKGMSLRYPKL